MLWSDGTRFNRTIFLKRENILEALVKCKKNTYFTCRFCDMKDVGGKTATTREGCRRSRALREREVSIR